jgi:pimeloyl-ACP methyl ester carboxylesterase
MPDLPPAPPGAIDLDLDGQRVHALTWGPETGPLALCLHGYPDTARTWRHLGPQLGARGWHVVAPYLRGYAPSGLAPDGNYQVGALARDALAVHARLGDERAVLIGHDWGAVAALVVGAYAPERFTRIVSLAIPPLALPATAREAIADLPLLLHQLRLSWYMLFQLLPGVSERALPRLIPRLWADWSPGYDGREDVAAVLASLRGPGRATAALRYYRALFLPWMRRRAYAPEQSRLLAPVRRPVLYLHGARDGCVGAPVAQRGAQRLPPGSEFELVPDCGHFLHLERPGYVGERVVRFVGLAPGAD